MPTTVQEWQSYLGQIYGAINSQRSEFEIFARLVEHTGMLSKVTTLRAGATRLKNKNATANVKETAQYFLARSFAWYFGLANWLNISTIDAVWNKYPGICPYCKQPVCRCYELDELLPFDPQYVRTVASYNRPTFMPDSYSLDKWRWHFEKIYRINRKFPLEQIFLHLFEELAEIAEALRLPRRDYINDEVGDIFAWLMGVVSGLRLGDGILQAALVAEYGKGCTQCGKVPCGCIIRLEQERSVGRRLPDVPQQDITRIEQMIGKAVPLVSKAESPADKIYSGPYNKTLDTESIDESIKNATVSITQFTKEASVVEDGVYELPGEYNRRVAVLGEFKTFPYMKDVAKKIAARGYIAVTSIAIFEKDSKSGAIKETPFKAYTGMGMNEFLNRFIMNCKYAVNIYTHDAGNIIESQWCYERRKPALGICLSRDLRTDPCCRYYSIETGGYGTCKYTGADGSMFCIKQTCPFTKHDMSKMVLDHYVGKHKQGAILTIINDLDHINNILDTMFPVL